MGDIFKYLIYYISNDSYYLHFYVRSIIAPGTVFCLSRFRLYTWGLSLVESEEMCGSIDLTSNKRASFDAAPEGISIIDTDLNILQVNRVMEEWYSHALPLIGKKCYKAYQDRDEPCSPCTSLRAIKTGEPAVGEVPLIRGNGPAGWLELNAFPVKNGDGRVCGVIEYVRDITERVKILDELNINREWNRALAEDIPALVLRISDTGKIVYVNEAVCSAVGEKRENLVGRIYYQFIPEPQRSRVKAYLSSLTPEQPDIMTEIQINNRWLRWKNRAIFDSRGKLKEYLNVGEDITENCGAQKKLRENEERNRALVGAIPDMLFRYNRDGVYLDAEIKDKSRLTDEGRRFYEEGLLVGKKIEDVLEPRISAHICKGIARALAEEKVQVIEYSYSVGEQRHYFEARLTAAGDDEVMAIVRDITDRRFMEEDLQYQLRFQKMVAEISSAFVSMPVTEFDNRIMYALKLCGLFFEADRSYIFRYSDDGLSMNVTHEWCAEGNIPQKVRNQDFPVGNTPWWVERMLNRGYVFIPDVDEMPMDSAKDQEDFRKEKIKSMMTMPILKEGRVIGFFGLDAVREKKNWDESRIGLVKVITEIITGAIINYETEEALKDSEKRYREILATIEEGYYEADLKGTITYCNEAACRHFGGYRREELIGKSYKEIYEDSDEAFKAFHQVFLTGEPERGLILKMIHKDGSFGFGEISISLIKDRQGYVTGFKGIGKDVTERIEYEKHLEYLSLHDQLTGIYNRTFFEAEMERFDKSREYPVTIISTDLDGLKLINDTLGHEAGDRLLKACAAVMQSSLRQSDILSRIGGDEFAAILLRTDKLTGEDIVRRIRENTDLYNRNNVNLHLGISIGAATADESETVLRELFKRADDIMYREKLYSSARSRNKIVQGLLKGLVDRDYITEGHTRRLQNLCRAMGEKIGLTSNQLTDLILLAQVHDLGKVGIPDKILFKEGQMNEEDWQIMRGHPEKGYRIAAASSDLAGVAELILKHRERWDGKGYPIGLSGEEIPVECRILAVADAFDTMIQKRPYDRKKTIHEAKEEIKKNAGSQFDPELVPIFFEVLKEQEGLVKRSSSKNTSDKLN